MKKNAEIKVTAELVSRTGAKGKSIDCNEAQY